MTYVDGFVLAIPTNNLDEYREMAQKAGEVWKEYGALDYRECVAEDTEDKGFGMMTFPNLINLKDDETAVFSYIVYPSREKRDEINKKVMEDARLKDSCNPEKMPFEMKRMAYGGFETLVEV